MFKFVGQLFLSIGKYISLPLLVGGSIFYLTHEWIDNHMLFRFPKLIALPTTNYVEYLGNWLVFNSDLMNENKIIYLYFIMIWALVLSIVGCNWPSAGIILIGVLLCMIEFVGIMYYNLNDWQTTIFNWGGLSIERIPSLNQLRLFYEREIDKTILIAPGFNPCQMARDALTFHANGEGLLQDMIEKVWMTQETYSNAAWAAKRYFHFPMPYPAEGQETSYDAWPDGWYYDYETFPEKYSDLTPPFDRNVAPFNNYPELPKQLDRDDSIGMVVWTVVGILAGDFIYETFVSGHAAPFAFQALCYIIKVGM